MLNPFTDINWKPGSKDLRDFARTFILAFPVFAGVLSVAVWARSGAWAQWPLWVGATGVSVGILCWLCAPVALPVYRVWHFLGCCMAAVVNNLVLALIFYLVITPIGLVLRLVRKDPLKRQWDPSAPSYWTKVEPPAAPLDYFRQF